MQSVGPGSVDKPLIDMATPQAERSARSQGGKRLTDAFESMPANKRSRLSVASALNDTDNLLNEDEGTDSLLNADEVGVLRAGSRAVICALARLFPPARRYVFDDKFCFCCGGRSGTAVLLQRQSGPNN